MERKKVIVSERIAEEGLELLETELEVDFRDGISREELLSIIDQYDALIVRSVTKVDEELIKRGTRLKVVGRAGNGVDNIDVDVCTRYGIIVANTPDSNTISAAEQTISLLLSSVRNTAWANDVLKGWHLGSQALPGHGTLWQNRGHCWTGTHWFDGSNPLEIL